MRTVRTTNLSVALFEVKLRTTMNEHIGVPEQLATVQIVSPTQSFAKRFVLQHYFGDGQWIVVECRKIRDV